MNYTHLAPKYVRVVAKEELFDLFERVVLGRWQTCLDKGD